MVHHTATASATGANGAPSLEWCATATSRGACNALIGRGKDDAWIINAAWAWHTGDGGPWPALGLGTGNVAHNRLWGIEVDDPGRGDTFTDVQIDYTARMCAAIVDLGQLSRDRIITHQSWTDGIDGVNPAGGSPYKGRKNDTLRAYYSADFWRAKAGAVSSSTPPTQLIGDDEVIILAHGPSYGWKSLCTGGAIVGLDPDAYASIKGKYPEVKCNDKQFAKFTKAYPGTATQSV